MNTNQLDVLSVIQPVGCAIRAERIARGLSIRKLAELADVPYNSIYLIERAKRCVTIPLLFKISNALNLELCIELKKREETTPPLEKKNLDYDTCFLSLFHFPPKIK